MRAHPAASAGSAVRRTAEPLDRGFQLLRAVGGLQSLSLIHIYERNAAINGKAGLRAFEAFSVLAPLAALALYAFEQISTAGVLTIIAVEVVASIVYFAQIARMQRIM